MSAILGIHYPDGRPVARADLERMVRSLAHRGPDGSGIWSDGATGLGQLMLQTTQESLRERLPYLEQPGELVITADARLDNRDELIWLLRPFARHASEITDSELLLAAYRQWGERCPEKLLGDFAFVIWDGRKQALFCARDHFGVKPFYYHSTPGKTFVFATEIKALLSLPEVPCRLNEERVADHLAEVFKDNEGTFYCDILRLPPGHSLTVSREGVRARCYWALDPARELRLGSNGEYAEAFRELFTEAVRCRLRSAQPVGSMLSGGLDSSSITCVARNLLAGRGERRLATFSTIFDAVPQCDERNYINAVLAQNGVEPHFIHGDQHGPFKHLERIHWHEDQAFYAPNFAMVWSIYGAVQTQGVRILLDGHDGDSTVSHGYKYLDELARNGRWLTLTMELRGLARHYGEAWWKLLRAYAWYFGINPLFKKHASLRLTRRAWRGLNRRLLRQPEEPARQAQWQHLLNPEFAARTDLAARYKAWRKTVSDTARQEREGHYRTLTQPIQPFALEVHDSAAAAFQIEKRYPFWDRRLVEFCLSLPPEQKLYRGWTRMVMRRAMDGILPAQVQWRGGKMDFSQSLAYGLRAFEREQLDDIIIHQPEVIEGYVNINSLRETYHRFLANDSSSDTTDLFNIWKSASLALWLRQAWPAHD